MNWFEDNDWWYLALAGIALLGACLLWQQWFLAIIVVGITVVVGLVEYITIVVTGLSTSDDFRVWSQKFKWKARVILTLMGIVVGLLIYHFAQKPNIY